MAVTFFIKFVMKSAIRNDEVLMALCESGIAKNSHVNTWPVLMKSWISAMNIAHNRHKYF